MRKLLKKLLLTLVLLLAALSSFGAAQARPLQHPALSWSRCTQHLDLATAAHVVAQSCRRYPLHATRAYGAWSRCTRQSLHVRVCIRAPYLRHVVVPVHHSAPVVQSAGAYTEPMLVTYYLATGQPMANGIYPSIGWAACGYDLLLGTRVFVPGIGILTCGDRIGFQPWHHIDVFGIPLGSGIRFVTVLR